MLTTTMFTHSRHTQAPTTGTPVFTWASVTVSDGAADGEAPGMIRGIPLTTHHTIRHTMARVTDTLPIAAAPVTVILRFTARDILQTITITAQDKVHPHQDA